MPYFRGEELADVYADAKGEGYGFVASNITHLDIMAGLVNGAATADSDVVLQVKRDTAEYVGNGDARAGMMAIDAHLRALSRDIDVGVFLNVDHVDADDDALIDADDLERILAGENPTHRVD